MMMLLIFSLLLNPFIFAEEHNGDVLKNIERNQNNTNEEIEIQMTIVEPDGTVRERKLLVIKKSEKEQKSLIKTIAPADLMSTSVLTFVSQDKDVSQWYYVPAEKRAREIKGHLRKTRFLDSELNMEDLNMAFYRNSTNQLLETHTEGTKTIQVFDSVPLLPKESNYSHVKTWVDATHKYPQKAEYYEADGSLLKTITYNNYKNIENQWRAQNIVVKNIKKNRSTQLDIKKITPKKFSESDFSPKGIR